MNDSTDIVAMIDAVASQALDTTSRPDAATTYGFAVRETGIGAAVARAAQHAQMGTVLSEQARFRLLKRMVLRVSSLFTRDQVAYNEAVLQALRSTEEQVQRLLTLKATIDLSRELGDSRLADDIGSVRAAVRELARRRDADRGELHVQRARVSMLLNELRAARPGTESDTAALDALINEDADDLGALYSHLEERFRGSRDEIRRRQTVYLEDVLPLRERGLPVLDIGPGRCEWLQLMQEHEVPAYGVDTNQKFVDEGRARGLDVRLGDGIGHLATVQEGSLAAVTGFHVVEHIPFHVLQRLFNGALYALMPGGLLLLETPNPSNISVGATTFWLDPTHQRPIPPELLSFLAEEHGFVDVEVRYPVWAEEVHFTTPPNIENDELRALIEAFNRDFFGPRDYAVLARKPAPA